jgi:hypothetical protein
MMAALRAAMGGGGDRSGYFVAAGKSGYNVPAGRQ